MAQKSYAQYPNHPRLGLYEVRCALAEDYLRITCEYRRALSEALEERRAQFNALQLGEVDDPSRVGDLVAAYHDDELHVQNLCEALRVSIEDACNACKDRKSERDEHLCRLEIEYGG